MVPLTASAVIGWKVTVNEVVPPASSSTLPMADKVNGALASSSSMLVICSAASPLLVTMTSFVSVETPSTGSAPKVCDSGLTAMSGAELSSTSMMLPSFTTRLLSEQAARARSPGTRRRRGLRMRCAPRYSASIRCLATKCDIRCVPTAHVRDHISTSSRICPSQNRGTGRSASVARCGVVAWCAPPSGGRAEAVGGGPVAKATRRPAICYTRFFESKHS